MSPLRRPIASSSALAALVALAGCSGGGAPSSSESTSGVATAGPTSAAASTSGGSATTTAPLAGVVIVLDPGHNGGNAANPREVNRLVDAGFGQRKACNTTGTETADGYPEHAQVWDVAQRLRSVLRAQGATVHLTRDSDTGIGPCVDERGAAGAARDADLVLSLHADGNANTSVRGFHIAYPSRMVGGAAVVQRSQTLARDVRDAFGRDTGMPRAGYLDGGSGLVQRSDLATLNLSRVPTVLVESGNMRNPADAALLKDPAFRQREARALAAGVRSFLNR
ncbi:N-acetylmuramoyl-L-alanine amidase [Dermacoccaceae bacterium W4C1]